jgi:hypothetical protein
MKTLLAITLILTSLFAFNATAQVVGLNASTAIANIESDDLAIVSGATAITFEIENIENANWFTTLINDYAALGNLKANSTIQGIVLTMDKGNATYQFIYDEVVRLFIPASLGFDGARDQKNEKTDLVSENRAKIAPWTRGEEVVYYGTAYDNWGLGNVTLKDLNEYGLGIEFKADADSQIKIKNIKATIFFANGVASTVTVNSFR